ncbi:hypothetical protein [Paracoccus sp. KR1-242]|uniref:hypothetical protein n=1 Tax=Paracoccus sp. KR1-242 TaxID=3410028 RepID=UPI003C03DAE4
MDILIDDDGCRVEIDRAALPTAERIVVTFAGVGRGRIPKGIPVPQFIGSASRYGAAVSVIDKNRTWGNGLNIPAIASCILDLADGRPVFTLGTSMGGFLAILFSTPLRAERTVSAGAQYSVCPSVMSSEHRWDYFARRIGEWWYPSLNGYFNLATKYVTLNGSIWQERRHWSQFPLQENAQHYVIEGMGHNLAARLKDAGALPGILDHAFLADWGSDMIDAGVLGFPARRLAPKGPHPVG